MILDSGSMTLDSRGTNLTSNLKLRRCPIAHVSALPGIKSCFTTYGSATQLTSEVAVADIATAGVNNITVQTPAPGGGTSNAFQFEMDSAASGTTTITTVTASVAPGSTASYPVTTPSSATNITVTCLNLSPEATCSYNQATNSVTIATSATTPAGTYQITVVFTLTERGAASELILLPILLLPLVFLRRRLAARGIWATACLGLILLAGDAADCMGIGCGKPSPAHQLTSGGAVTLTVP